MNRAHRASIASLGAALVLMASAAAAAEPTDAYATYYGDGLRHYAEGEFGEAVAKLFRAYALESEASTLGLIISSYDQMGYCDAAARQIDVHRRVHPGAEPPKLSRCASTGSLQINCTGPEAKVTVDRQFDVSCGARLRLPVGEHRVAARRAESPEPFTIVEGQTTSVQLAFTPEPERWNKQEKTAGRAERAGQIRHKQTRQMQTRQMQTRVARIPDAAARVDRLEHARTDYTVFQSDDGLYRIFIHPSEHGAGGVLPLPIGPDVLRLCDTDESFDEGARRCEPVRQMQIQKME